MKFFSTIFWLIILAMPLSACQKDSENDGRDDPTNVVCTYEGKENTIGVFTYELENTLNSLCYTASKTIIIENNETYYTYSRSISTYKITSPAETKYAFSRDTTHMFWAVKSNDSDIGTYGESTKKNVAVCEIFSSCFDIYKEFEGEDAEYYLEYKMKADISVEPVISETRINFTINKDENKNIVINCVYEGEYLTSFDYEYVHYDDSYAKVIKEKCIMTVEQKDFDEFTIDLPDFTNWEQIK